MPTCLLTNVSSPFVLVLCKTALASVLPLRESGPFPTAEPLCRLLGSVAVGQGPEGLSSIHPRYQLLRGGSPWMFSVPRHWHFEL